MGSIWVLSLGDESVMAFTDDGVDSLVELDQDPPGNEAARGVLISAPSASPRGLCRTVTIIRAKVGLLELAKQLGNVSQARKIMGYSRDSFYRFKEL